MWRKRSGDQGNKDVPNVHGVHERRAAVGGPHAAVGELGHVPHDLVHDLGELDGVAGGAGAAAGGAAAAVGDVALVVVAVEVDAVPAAIHSRQLLHTIRWRVRKVKEHRRGRNGERRG